MLGGDEMGRTQGGNDNTYGQDNDISWFHGDTVDQDLLAFTTRLIDLRKSSPALRPTVVPLRTRRRCHRLGGRSALRWARVRPRGLG
jgi:pullulanase/glycogen debranching enzyme